MEISAIDAAQRRVVVELTYAEVIIINNTLNELIHGFPQGQEVLARLGATELDVNALLYRIQYVLNSGIASHRMLLGLRIEELRLIDGALHEVLGIVPMESVPSRIGAEGEVQGLHTAFESACERVEDTFNTD